MSIAPIISEHVVDLQHDTNYVFEVAPQGDARSRYCDIILLDNGVPYIPPEDSTIVLEGKNSGGFNIFNECTVENNVIRVPLQNGVLSFAGLGEYRITIYKDIALSSFKFNIFVTEAPYNVVELQASDSYEVLTNLIKSASEFNKWIVGSGVPDSSIGNVKDYYLDSDSGNIYQKNKNDSQQEVWELTGYNIKENIYIKYSEDSSSASPMVDIPTIYTKYIGIYVGTTQPTQKSEYSWSKFLGDDGNKWYSGTAFVGQGTSYTGVSGNKGDMYLNTNTHQVYECKTSGSSSTATWDYILTISGGGVEDYEALNNLPKINNVELIGDLSTSDLLIDVPTKISDLTDDVDMVTDSNYVHTDNNYSDEEKNKLSTVENNANNYSLPIATTSVLGGVKGNNNSEINISQTGELDLSTEAKAKLSNFNNDGTIATGSELDDALGEKANSDNVYSKTDIDNKVPFTLAIDNTDPSNPVYGYIKAGADTVTPFKTGGTLVREYLGEYNVGSSINIAQRFPDLDLTNITSSNFSIMPARAVSTSGSNGPDYYSGMNRLKAACSATYNVPSISYNPSNHTVSWSVGSLSASGTAETDAKTKSCSGTNSNPYCYIYFYHN